MRHSFEAVERFYDYSFCDSSSDDELFRDDNNCIVVDEDFERLVFRHERAVNMESVEILNEVRNASLELSYVNGSNSDGIKAVKTLKRKNDAEGDHKLTCFLSTPRSTLVKIEFKDTIKDRRYFFLMGIIELSEREMIKLCQKLEETKTPDEELDQLQYKLRN
jgi:hypothetical protein